MQIRPQSAVYWKPNFYSPRFLTFDYSYCRWSLLQVTLVKGPKFRKMLFVVCLFYQSRHWEASRRAPLGSYVEPLWICQLHKMFSVARINSLQWYLLYPWARQQLNHFWIPKEPDELCDWPHKGFRKRYNIVIHFTFLANGMSDPIQCPAGGPKMLWVFKRWVAKST